MERCARMDASTPEHPVPLSCSCLPPRVDMIGEAGRTRRTIILDFMQLTAQIHGKVYSSAQSCTDERIVVISL